MRFAFLAAGFSAALLCAFPAFAEEQPKLVPAPALDNAKAPGDPQTALLAGGCYWGTQGMFEHVKGVQRVIAGFAGLPQSRPQDGIIGRTEAVPAEAVQITFDPSQITYGQILQIYFSVAHDPTQLNMQGPDKGPQYRSAIFYADDTQKKIAEAYIAQLDQAHAYSAPIVTTVGAAIGFRRVASQQQDFMQKYPTLPYIVAIDVPRLTAMKTLFPSLYRDPPLTVSGEASL